jgi:tetratricopeptide (TPR) repeat protein
VFVKSDRLKDLYLRALIGRAKMFKFTGQYQDALKDFRMIKRNTRDPRYQFEYYRGVSSVLERMGRFRPAIALVERAIRLSRRCRDLRNDSLLLNTKVHLLIHKGDNAGALKLCHTILRKNNRARGGSAASGKEHDLIDKATLLKNIAYAYYAMEKYKKALGYYLRARQYYRQAKYLEGVSDTDNNLTLIYWKTGNYKKALAHSHEALTVREKIGHGYGLSSTLNNMGLINDEMGNYPEALRFYEKALANFYRLNDIYGLTIALTNIGSIYHEIFGDIKRAYVYYEKSYQYSRKTGDPLSEAEGLLAMAEMHWQMENRRAFVQDIAALNRLMPGIRSAELSAMFLLVQIKLRVWKRDRTGVNSKVDELLALLKRSRNDLLAMESVAALIDIIYRFDLEELRDKIALAAGEMGKNLPAIESPLKRTKILRALVKYHLLANDRVRAGKYFKEWEDVSTWFGIKAEKDEIVILRPIVQI